MVSHVTDTGLAEFTGALVTQNDVKFIGWGTGSGAAQSATNMTTPRTTESRTSGTISQQTTTTANDTYRVTGSITCITTPAAITETGVFDATGTGAVMRIYGDFSVINLAVNDSITFTIDTVLNQA